MVNFKDTGLLDSTDSIGSTIETSTKDHHLVHTAAESFTEDIVDVSRTDRHRSSGT